MLTRKIEVFGRIKPAAKHSQIKVFINCRESKSPKNPPQKLISIVYIQRNLSTTVRC